MSPGASEHLGKENKALCFGTRHIEEEDCVQAAPCCSAFPSVCPFFMPRGQPHRHPKQDLSLWTCHQLQSQVERLQSHLRKPRVKMWFIQHRNLDTRKPVGGCFGNSSVPGGQSNSRQLPWEQSWSATLIKLTASNAYMHT